MVRAAETWILAIDLKNYSVSVPYRPEEVPPEEKRLPQIILIKKGRSYAAEFKGRVPYIIRDIAGSVWIAYKDPEWVEKFVEGVLARMQEAARLAEARGERKKRFTYRDLEDPAASNPLEEYFEPEPPARPEPDLDPEYRGGGE